MRISDWSSDVCSSDLRDFHVRYFALSLLTHSRRCGPLTRANRKTEAPLAETVGASAPVFCLGRRPDPHEAGEPRRCVERQLRREGKGVQETKDSIRSAASARREERTVGKKCIRTCIHVR